MFIRTLRFILPPQFIRQELKITKLLLYFWGDSAVTLFKPGKYTSCKLAI